MPAQQRNSIPDGVKAFIVRRLACFDSTSEIREAVKAEYGLDVSTNSVRLYDPTIRDNVAQELVDLFWAAREKFVEGLDDIAIVHKAYRLKKLDEMFRQALGEGDRKGAMDILRQAAEDFGGVFDKKQGALTLETLQKEMDRLASAVASNVSDPEVLAKIDAAWSQRPPAVAEKQKRASRAKAVSESWDW